MSTESTTPTDAERELAQVIKDFWWECEAGSKPPKGVNGDPSAGDVALAVSILAAGFRRAEVPAPQGEPSDAQVDAAKEAINLRYYRTDTTHFDAYAWGRLYRQMAVDALRAAGGVR